MKKRIKKRLASLSKADLNDGDREVASRLVRANNSWSYGFGVRPIDRSVWGILCANHAPVEEIAWITEIVHFKRLSVLDFHSMAMPFPVINAEAAETIGACASLEVLTVNRCLIQSDPLKIITAQNQLEALCLVEVNLGIGDIENIISISSLKILNICFNPRVDDSCVPALARLRRLKRLYLEGTKISPSGLSRLKEELPQTRIITILRRS